MLKYYIKVIVRNLLKIFWLFPIDKKKIYFQSFGGESMNCNPWYIFKYMYEKYPDYKYVWLLNHEPEDALKRISFVRGNTIKWLKNIITSHIIITNCGFSAYIPYRKKQTLIETWHGGGAYKKVDSFAYLNKKDAVIRSKKLSYVSNYLSYYVSSSKKFSEVMSISHKTALDKFLNIGMPRNDVFFNELLVKENRKKVCQKYSIKADDLIVVYAPTYRGTPTTATFDNSLDTSAIKQQINKTCGKDVVILFRGHHELKKRLVSTFDIDVSEYPDMQELLCTADILITDYSSAMWDYSFLYRPCFLFVPDFEEYMTNRGFYTDPYSWGFPICKTNEELIDAIRFFNQSQIVAAMNKHHDNFESYEKGVATQKISEIISNTVNEIAK